MYMQKNCKTLQFAIKQFKHSPLRHVCFLQVHHTWLDFSRQNLEGVRQEYQELCGTQLLLVHQWMFLRFEAGMNTCSDTMFNFVNLDPQACMNSHIKEDCRRERSNSVNFDQLFMEELKIHETKNGRITLHPLISE